MSRERIERPRSLSRRFTLLAAAAPAMVGHVAMARAYDLTDWLSIGGVAAAAGQCQQLSESEGASDECRGALPLQPEISIRPTDRDELFVKLGFARGNALNDDTPFELAPWGADLHDDVTDINGRYDHVLNAWYAHRFDIVDATVLPDDTTLTVTAGIIDATDYLDDNAYANDEYVQFMNEAFVNAPDALLPSYDVGGVLQLDAGSLSLRGVIMNVGDNDDGNSFFFGGAQVGYTIDTSLGAGTYRGYMVGSNQQFLNPAGTSEENRLTVGLSFDQRLGDVFGAFVRLAWQDDQAAIDYEAIYTGGINILGGAWGRQHDDVGVGFGVLDGGNQDISATRIAEIYYRAAITDNVALTADVQHMKDERRGDGDPSGFILGLRATAMF